MSCLVEWVPPPHVGALWPKIGKWVRPARHNEGDWTPEWVRRQLIDGRMQLWASDKAIWITRIVDRQQARVLSVWFIGGEPGGQAARDDYHAAFIEVLDRYAVEKGCAYMEGRGRKGWNRAAPDEWKPIATVFRRDVKCT